MPCRHLYALSLLGLVFWHVLPQPALGQRIGVIQGTYEACISESEDLRQQLQEVQAYQNADAKYAHLKQQDLQKTWTRRLAAVIDRCAAKGDAPISAIIEAVSLYEQAGDDLRALTIVQQALGRFPEEVSLNLAAGELLQRQDRGDEAVDFFEAVLKRQPTNIRANRALGTYYYSIGQTAEAIPYLQRYAETQQNSFEAAAALGDACLDIERFRCAARYLSRASSIRPTDTLLAIKVGDLGYKIGDYETSSTAYRRATDQNPRRTDAWLGLGKAQERLGLLENAQFSFSQSHARSPSTTAILGMARTARKRGRLDPALRWTQALLKTSELPQDDQIRVRREHAAALNAMSKYPESWEFYSSLPAAQRDDLQMLLLAGDSRLQQKPEEALKLFNQASNQLARQTAWTDAVIQRQIRAQRRLQRFNTLSETSSANPSVQREQALFSFSQSLQALKQNEPERAKASLKTALTLQPQDPLILRAATLLDMNSAPDPVAEIWKGIQNIPNEQSLQAIDRIDPDATNTRLNALRFSLLPDTSASVQQFQRERLIEQPVWEPAQNYRNHFFAGQAYRSFTNDQKQVARWLAQVTSDADFSLWKDAASTVHTVRQGQRANISSAMLRTLPKDGLNKALQAVQAIEQDKFERALQLSAELKSAQQAGAVLRSESALRMLLHQYNRKRKQNLKKTLQSPISAFINPQTPRQQLALYVVNPSSVSLETLTTLLERLDSTADKNTVHYLKSVQLEQMGKLGASAEALNAIQSGPLSKTAVALKTLRQRLLQPFNASGAVE